MIFPFLLTAPYSFEALIRPARFLAEPGLNLAGGSTALVLSGNPGGAGSLPWWTVSPILLLLIIALFHHLMLVLLLKLESLFCVQQFYSHPSQLQCTVIALARARGLEHY